MANVASTINDYVFSIEYIKEHILSQYSLENSEVSMIKFKDTEKQRAVYKVIFCDKEYCLKKVYYQKEDLLYVYSAIEWLFRHNINVPKLLPTNIKGRFVSHNNMLYILTPWIEGYKCDFDNTNHLISSIIELAKLHKCSINFEPIKGSKQRKGMDDLYISTLKHFEQLLQSSNKAFKIGDTFSKEFLFNFENNLELAKLSLEVASSIDNSCLSSSLCHGDYVNKNIIFSPSNKVWLIDFDKCKYDYCAHDISYFLRRLLKRTSTNWDLDLTLVLLNSYNKYRHLTDSDLKYIVSYICFPQKFWKLSRDYYKNINKCNKNSFERLLVKCNENIYKQLEFSTQIVSTMNSFNWQL